MMSVIKSDLYQLCDGMLQTFLRSGYQVALDSYTPADGNCFYHAILQQLGRPEFQGKVSETFRTMDHATLRMKVSEHVSIIQQNEIFEQQKIVLRENRQERIDREVCTKMIQYGLDFIPPPVNQHNVQIAESETEHETRTKMNVDTIHAHELRFLKMPLYQEPSKFSWDSYFANQSSTGVVAEEIWIRGAAHLLGVDIHVSTPRVNMQNPVHKMSHRITDSANDDQTEAPFFLMGNAGNHFQSFIPVATLPSVTLPSTSVLPTYAEAVARSPPRKKAATRTHEQRRLEIESNFREKMLKCGLGYIYPPPNETQKHRDVRYARFRREIKRYEEQHGATMGSGDSPVEKPKVGPANSLSCKEFTRPTNNPPARPRIEPPIMIDDSHHDIEFSVEVVPAGENESSGELLSCKNSMEITIKEKMNSCGLSYEKPAENETSLDRILRTKRMKYAAKNHENKLHKTVHDVEQDLRQKMVAHGLKYVSPMENETPNDRKLRRQRMKYVLDNAEINIQSQQTHVSQNEVNTLQSAAANPVLECLDFIIDSVSTSVDSHNREENLKYLHSRPEVQEAILRFETSETKHTVARCITCREVRPVFHVEKYSKSLPPGRPAPMYGEKWKLNKSGRCEACQKDINLSKRQNKQLQKKKQQNNLPSFSEKRAARFSGIKSPEEDLAFGPTANSYLRHNDMHFREVPPYLVGLTTTETALVSKISVLMNVHVLKTGMFANKGHCVSLPQPMKEAKRLPLLPAEVNIVILKRVGADGKTRHYHVKRSTVQNALEGLCFGYPHGGCNEISGAATEKYNGKDHIQMPLHGRYFQYIPNMYYHDVEIMYDRIDQLPEQSSLWSGLTVVERPDKVYENKDDHPLNPEEPVDITHSGLIRPLQPSENDDVDKLLRKIVGDGEALNDLLQSRSAIQMNWDRIDSDPVPELKTPGFFSMAYPTIFIGGSCDITVQRLVNVDFTDWVEHIYFNEDNRVAAHSYLKFFLLNLRMRQQALSQGSFLVSQQLNDAHLSISELRDKLLNHNDTSVPRKVTNIASNFVNTDPYWRERNKELDALGVYRKKEEGDVMAYFRTHSCAEFHWVPLHELLIKYHATIYDENVDDVRSQFYNDNKFKIKLIQENNHIITNHFDARHLNYINTVDMALFDCDDIWFRYEFAQLRGAIHTHKCIYSKTQWSSIQRAYNGDDLDDDVPQSQQLDSAAVRLEKVLQTTSLNNANFSSPEFVSLHPAGGIISQYDNGEYEWRPNKTQWAAPEGTSEPPERNPLTQDLQSILHLKDGMKNLHIDLCNKLGLHKCSKSYCLKLPRKKNYDNETGTTSGSTKEPRVCRFHFGTYDENTRTSSGKDLHPFEPSISPGEHPRFEGRRDHPRFLQHTKATMLSWKANSDTQAVLKQNLIALQNYLTQYACKGAAKTSDFIKIYEILTEQLDDSTSVKSLCQRLLLKIVGYVDIPEPCADFINTGGKLYRCTRSFRRVGLSGYRMIDQDAVTNFVNNSKGSHKSAGNTQLPSAPPVSNHNQPQSSKNQPQTLLPLKLTRETVFDKFMSQSRRQKYPKISLYDWAKLCDKKCSCKCNHVPVFTGVLIKPTWPPSDELSKALLMIYSPGTWHQMDDLKNCHPTFLEAFAEFLDSNSCPVHLTEMMDEAKDMYDRKQQRASRARLQVDNTDLSQTNHDMNFSQQSLTSSQSSIYNRRSYRESIFTDIQNGQYQDDPDLEQLINTGGLDFDWHTFGLECVAEVDIPQHSENWIDNTSDIALEHFFKQNDEVTLTETNLLLANELQRIAISIVAKHLLHLAKHGEDCDSCENEAQISMLLSGTAGTGKTFVLNGINRIAQRLFRRNGAVLNLAPTGAASVLIPNGRTIHSVIPMPRKKKDKDMLSTQLCDHPMSNEQLKMLRRYTGKKDQRKVKALIVDERSLIPHEIVAWTDHRLSEALVDENIFGGTPVVLFSGDNGQLGPIGSVDLHLKPNNPVTPIQDRGYALYRTHFDKVIVLEETMRQGPDQVNLLNMLLRIRSGEIVQKDWQDINARHEGNLSPGELANFRHDKVITLCETWRDVNMENRTRLNQISLENSIPIALISSLNNGKHTTGKNADKYIGQIPPIAELIVGGRYILTKNQCGLTAYKLNNGAMGTLKAIIYDEGVRPPQHPRYVIMDIPTYNGPPWLPAHPTWIPISPQSGLCDYKCCTRVGMPLAPAYAMTIAKAQGMNIGAGKMVTHMRLKLQKHSKFENLAPSTTYVGLSRVDMNSTWTLVDTIDWTRLNSINNHDTILKRRAEDARLKSLHEKTIAEHFVTKAEYLQLLREIDEFSNEQILDETQATFDAICTLDNSNCTCVACTV